mmetsp:Transcript_23875/g.35031  ORF Transcript_23875/g.35031 Transcript_23875/m.35031 type:complete len:445 (-) Transcript_23875:113-1447(-)|eukprot:CAMPEP_0185041344 /NCGR_PEP_ID=MMETSP1103-20130426/40529_1 /TAXON_ID=36769 /ORGANISM="Paraphysomonas bandaiensis, Strain Caron Lab Isolate" /LENGTH=444 /DNA_ID=CAMNT_0027581029 /DNA_START=143 /DNA_END=1477 /DNA_ORIENTATION=-
MSNSYFNINGAPAAPLHDSKLQKLRDDLSHSGDYIHLNNAGASPAPKPVLSVVKDVLEKEHVVGGYEAQRYYSQELNAVYHSIGRLINASDPENEIALVDSATTAWIRAFYSIPLTVGDVILASKVEYGANYVAMLQRAKRTGASVMYIPSDSTGQVSLPALANMLNSIPTVKVVSLTWIPTNGGVVNNAEGVGHLCSAHPRVFYLLDACQAVGHVVVNVQALQCHALAGTGRKYLRGPRGTGFLYISSDVLGSMDEPITIDHFSASWVELNRYEVQPSAKRYEQWEKNVAGLIGFGKAVDYLLDESNVGVVWAQDRIRSLAKLLRKSLKGISRIESDDTGSINPESDVNTCVKVWDMGSEDDPSSQCGIVTFTVRGIDPGVVKKYLSDQNVFVSVSAPPSTLIDATERSLPELVRASVHYFNTELEIFIFCDMLRELILAIPD